MPLLFKCEDLQSGMRLSEPFRWNGLVMLPRGKILGDVDVSVLQRKYPGLCLRVSDPILDAFVEFEDDSHDRKVACVAREKVAACVGDVQQRFADRTSMEGVNYGAVRSAATDVMAFISRHPVSCALLDMSVDPGSPLSGHTGNVFYLSLMLGAAVSDYVRRERRRQTRCLQLSSRVAVDLLPLALGTMFMDVGMYELQHLLNSDGQLTDADREALRQHPIKGAEMLPDTMPPGTKMVVRTHHENFDGSGYPTGQTGDAMHVFTRIVRICDAFVAATTARVHRAAKSPARVIWEMCCGPYRGCYDPVLARLFTGLIQPFPIGAKIRLQDGRHAVIVRYNRTDPFRPSAVICFDAAGNRLPDVQIVGPVTIGDDGLRLGEFDGEDLSFVYDLPSDDYSGLKLANGQSSVAFTGAA